ncbi:MAG TPA: M23 family metallopeptidase [Vicinamibacterales bacterium]|nr:M23 family metallopeptidase [Vicinamibacterales bacterium]
MTRRASRGSGLAPLAIAFVLGAALGAGVLWRLNLPAAVIEAGATEAKSDDCGAATYAVAPATNADSDVVPASAPGPVPSLEAEPMSDLRARDLRMPVEGVKKTDLVRSFGDRRGSDRQHEAIDIPAPRHTPVYAVEDGTIAKLFYSKAGGITVYQFDPGEQYAYYYAHLERYAAGLKDGDRVKRGDVIGYVGTSGNAPPGTPHLHFAIFKLTDQKRWWQGTPLDPFDVLR